MIADLAFLRLHRCDREAFAGLRVFDSHGAILIDRSVSLSEVAALAGDRRLIACLPGTESLYLSVTLPPMPSRKLREALPYAVEDRLIDDVSGMHLAVGAAQTSNEGQQIDLEIIPRDRLQSWCELLTSAGLRPSALYVDAAALPATPQGCLWRDGDHVHIRTASGERTSLESDAWPALRAQLHAAELELLDLASDLPERLMRGRAINLLQGEFAAHAAAAPAKNGRRWRLAASLLAVVLVVQLGVEILGYERSRDLEAALDAELLALAAPTLAGGGSPQQVVAHLEAALAPGASPIDPVAGSAILEALGVIAEARTGASFTRLSGDEQRLVIELNSSPPVDTAPIDTQLRSSGWEFDAADAADKGIRWTIRRIEAAP